MASGRKQGWFESDDAYRERMRREADEGRIEHSTGDTPSQGLFESDSDYSSRIAREADEGTVEKTTGARPTQGWFESDNDYDERIKQESNERTVEDVTGQAPSQGWFESDSDYRHRVEREADESTIERATGERPSQGWLESDADYEESISSEADEHDSDNKDSSGCFLTTACTDAAGLADNCHELQVLRRFRDGYLARRVGGCGMIEEYYRIAPRVVEFIDEASDKRELLDWILANVRGAVHAIESDEPERALVIYRAMFAKLADRFISPSSAVAIDRSTTESP